MAAVLPIRAGRIVGREIPAAAASAFHSELEAMAVEVALRDALHRVAAAVVHLEAPRQIRRQRLARRYRTTPQSDCSTRLGA